MAVKIKSAQAKLGEGCWYSIDGHQSKTYMRPNGNDHRRYDNLQYLRVGSASSERTVHATSLIDLSNTSGTNPLLSRPDRLPDRRSPPFYFTSLLFLSLVFMERRSTLLAAAMQQAVRSSLAVH